MSIYEIVILALALAADAFSVGAAVGISHRKFRQVFRLSFHFGLFHALLPLLGMLLGSICLSFVQGWDHWVVFGLLALIGGRMIFEGVRNEKSRKDTLDFTKGLKLVGLSIVVSIDSFAAGVSLVVTGAPIALSVGIIGLIAALATAIAMLAAGFVSRWIGKRCDIVAGVVLIGLGFKFLLEHLGLFSL